MLLAVDASSRLWNDCSEWCFLAAIWPVLMMPDMRMTAVTTHHNQGLQINFSPHGRLWMEWQGERQVLFTFSITMEVHMHFCCVCWCGVFNAVLIVSAGWYLFGFPYLLKLSFWSPAAKEVFQTVSGLTSSTMNFVIAEREGEQEQQEMPGVPNKY